MTAEFILPDLGEGIHEAEIIAVKVKEGDTVKEDQVIFEVETDKAVVEIPSPYAGVVSKIHVQQGQTVTVGSTMISVEAGGSASAAPGKTQETKEKTEAKSVADTAKSSAAKAETKTETKALAGVSGNGKGAGTTVDRSRPVPATPATRRLARELGVDLYAVSGSGAAGRVMKEDVMSFAAGSLESKLGTSSSDSGKQSTAGASSSPAKPASSAASSMSVAEKFGGSEGGGGGGGPLNFGGRAAGGHIEYPDFAKHGKVERLPLKSIRRKIAQSMTQSWTLIPHVTTFDEANVSDLTKLISKYEKEYGERAGNPKVRPTMTVFVLKAVASALQRFPQFNSSLDENTGEIVIKHYYNLGVAVATERGLIVPVIKNINEKSFFDVAVELADIAAKTRAGKIELDRLQGGTFTVTNIGAIGGTGAAPMINFPECAIMGMARAVEKPIVKNGAIEIGTIMPLFMSFDHRLADGAEAAYFVQHVVKLLEDPFKFVLDI